MTKGVYNSVYNQEDWDAVLLENKIVLDDFILELRQRRRAVGTIKQYYNDMRIFLIYVYRNCNNKSILQLSRRELKTYSIWLTEECGVSVARHNRLWSSMQSLYNYCEEDEELHYSNDIARKIKGLQREPVREIFFLSDVQVLRLEEELIRREEYQLATLLMLAYDSAARKNEIAQVLKHGFYDDAISYTNKVIGKRRKVFNLIYFEETKKCARLWLEQRGHDEFDSLWVYHAYGKKQQANANKIYRMFMEIRNVFTEVEGKETKFNVHSMRHSALQNMADGTHYICVRKNLGKLDLTILKSIANHEKVDTTEGYLKDDKLSVMNEVFGVNIENN
jgi:integrase